MKLYRTIFYSGILCLLTSCAGGYKTINPSSLNYISESSDASVNLSYKYDVLNNRDGKKEQKNGIKLVAVKITNNGTKDLIFGKDVKLIYANNNEPLILDNVQTYNELKQGTAIYLLYLLLTPAKLNVSSSNGSSSSAPIGYALGPGIAGGNIIAASTANTNFKNELMQNNLLGVTIKKGTTVYGLIGLKSGSAENLKIKVE